MKTVRPPEIDSAFELNTPRLKLRQWCEGDLKPFAAMNADAKVMEYFPRTLTRVESDRVAEKCRSLIAERNWGFWAVETREDNQFIGFVGLHIPAHDLPFMPCVEIGWRLAANYWGKGLATEAAHAALTVGFKKLNLQEIVAFTALPNRRSQALMQRLGMSTIREENFGHPAVSADSPLYLHCLYRLSRLSFTG